MNIVTPYSNSEKIDLLQACLRELLAAESSVPPFPEALVAEIQAGTAAFRAANLNLVQARERYKGQVLVVRAAELALVQRIRDGLQLVRRMTRDDAFPPQLFEAFGLLRDGTMPPALRQMKAPIEAALRMVAAHENAVAAGYFILTNPTSEELTSLADALAAAQAALVTVRTAEQTAYAAMLEARSVADALLAKVKASVRLAAVGLDRQAQRTMFQNLGFRYRANRRVVDADAGSDAAADDNGRSDDAATGGDAQTDSGTDSQPGSDANAGDSPASGGSYPDADPVGLRLLAAG